MLNDWWFGKFIKIEYMYYATLMFFCFPVYIDMGTGASDTATLNFDFTDSTSLQNSRFFEVKVTQLPCSSEYK